MIEAPATSRKSVLVASTTWWTFPARVAMAFDDRGWDVFGICWYGNPMAHTRSVRKLYRYMPFRPLASLRAAIARTAPDLIVPCDDRALEHLHALHARTSASGPAAVAATIARSLGRPDSYPAVQSRGAIIALARDDGVRAPETIAVDNEDELRAAVAKVGIPAVLKADGTWGGTGVEVASSPDNAVASFRRLSRRHATLRALKRLLINRDPFPLGPSLRLVRPRVNVQGFVKGRPANCLVSCLDGQMLDGIFVDVICARHAMGAATVVRAIDRPEMAEAARRIVGRLGLSGFCGFDFVIDDATGAPHLIEMNARMTPIGHLQLGPGHDPLGALAARVAGLAHPASVPVTANDTIALFPQAWLRDPDNPLLTSGHHDVPWRDPALLRELLRLPWPERGVAVRLFDRLRRGSGRPSSWTISDEPAVPAWHLAPRP